VVSFLRAKEGIREGNGMANPLLSVTDLRIAFNDHVIFQDLTFELNHGEGLAVIGPNGSGKTILLKALLNLIPYKGEIRWSREARPGYVPQRVAPERHLPLSVKDLLAAKVGLLKLPESDVTAVSREVGLPAELLESGIATLSGGQLQKALIALALLGRPNVLLFDEPTASLDELSEEHIYELLHSLQQEKGMTVILVSHDLSVVYQYAGKVLCLSKGRACMGPPREILTPELLEEMYGVSPRYYRHVDEH
jgi:zinc transport system ATP-binding protein